MKCLTTVAAGAKFAVVNRAGLALAILLLGTVALMAQTTPVAPEGTQVATEQTPAAAANADELRKEAQTPVASLISVPVQDNFNGGIDPAQLALLFPKLTNQQKEDDDAAKNETVGSGATREMTRDPWTVN